MVKRSIAPDSRDVALAAGSRDRSCFPKRAPITRRGRSGMRWWIGGRRSSPLRQPRRRGRRGWLRPRAGLEVGVRGGGHSVLGLSVPEAGLMIDLSLLRSVRIDPDRRRAWVAGGALLGALDGPPSRLGWAGHHGRQRLPHRRGWPHLGGGMVGWRGSTAGLRQRRPVPGGDRRGGSCTPASRSTQSCTGGCAVAAGTSEW